MTARTLYFVVLFGMLSTAAGASAAGGSAESAVPVLSSILTGTNGGLKRVYPPFDAVTGILEPEKPPEPVDPLFVRPLVRIETGRNDSNPVWSPKGTFLAFERSVGDNREIHITYADGTPVQTVSLLPADGGGDLNFLLPGMSAVTSYNAGISWSPDENRFVFMSNGGEGNYDLYLQDLGGSAAKRLTEHREKDGQAQWSPVANRIVLVSGRTGNGDLYLLVLPARPVIRLTRGGKPYFYPQWSPDGKKIAMMHGSNENHDILLMSNTARPVESQRPLTTWVHDDLRPVWSPDGTKVAFYSNYNAAADPRIWSIIVVSADGSDSTEGDGLAAKVVATDIIPDVEVGPAWMPDSSRIVFVKNDRIEYNPLYIVDIGRKSIIPIKTDTRMNHDVACSADGTIAFRAQVNQWDQIYIMKLKE